MKPQPDRVVVAWLRKHEREIVLDPIVLGELHFGILVLPKGKRRSDLEEWFQTNVRSFGCLDWTPNCGIRWAELVSDLRRRGKSMPIKDSQIAATALAYGLTLVTRNAKDFANSGVRALNPFVGT
jgi:toxin FitB